MITPLKWWLIDLAVDAETPLFTLYADVSRVLGAPVDEVVLAEAINELIAEQCVTVQQPTGGMPSYEDIGHLDASIFGDYQALQHTDPGWDPLGRTVLVVDNLPYSVNRHGHSKRLMWRAFGDSWGRFIDSVLP